MLTREAETETVDGLTPAECQAVKQFLEQVNKLGGDTDSNHGNKSPVSWSTSVKFLMARKFDVKRAIDLYQSHENIRKKEHLNHTDPREDSIRRELVAEKFTVLPSRDSNGAAIALFTARLHRPESTSHQAVLTALILQLDHALDSLETQRNGLVFVYDMTSSKYQHFDYDLSIKILSLLKGSYPARLKKVLIVTAPLWFKAPFKILRLFVREKLRDRVFTVSHGQLQLHIPISALPTRLGGKMEINHKDWIRKCLQSVWGKSSDTDNEITTYLESVDNHIMTDLSVSSISSGLGSPITEEGGFFSSDLDSVSSKGTVQEKHCMEGSEKAYCLDGQFNPMEVSDDNGSLSPPENNTTNTPGHHSKPGKRSSETPPGAAGQDGRHLPPAPHKRRPPSGDHSEQDSIHMPEHGGFVVKELAELCRIKGRKGLYREYAQIKGEPPVGTFEVSKAKPNLPKNRYTDVLCLDQSRVRLTLVDGDNNSDYINANYVDGYRHKGAYISTQGPLPRTFPDFWRMVWEQMVLLVVMTTRTVERSRLKCGQYWPTEENGMEEHGDFVIINSRVDQKQDYIVSTLVITNKKTDETRELTHFQYTSWPDYGVPPTAAGFLKFMFHVREKQASRLKELTTPWRGHPEGPPIVIHCSAGIGRTGTFITMDICTRRLADIGTVDIQKTVKKIRGQRAFSIQMPDQYVFCHLALLEHASRENLIDHYDLDDFEDSSSDSE